VLHSAADSTTSRQQRGSGIAATMQSFLHVYSPKLWQSSFVCVLVGSGSGSSMMMLMMMMTMMTMVLLLHLDTINRFCCHSTIPLTLLSCFQTRLLRVHAIHRGKVVGIPKTLQELKPLRLNDAGSCHVPSTLSSACGTSLLAFQPASAEVGIVGREDVAALHELQRDGDHVTDELEFFRRPPCAVELVVRHVVHVRHLDDLDGFVERDRWCRRVPLPLLLPPSRSFVFLRC